MSGQVQWEEAFEVASRRAARAAVRRYRNGAIVGFLILAFGCGWAVDVSQNSAVEASRAAVVRKAATLAREAGASECKRVNILRAQSNVANDVSFSILTASVIREEALANADASTRAPLHRASVHAFVSQAARLRVTKLTDCSLAVNDPAHYRYPFAGPIGNPRTGQRTASVEKIIKQSERLVAQNTKAG